MTEAQSASAGSYQELAESARTEFEQIQNELKEITSVSHTLGLKTPLSPSMGFLGLLLGLAGRDLSCYQEKPGDPESKRGIRAFPWGQKIPCIDPKTVVKYRNKGF